MIFTVDTVWKPHVLKWLFCKLAVKSFTALKFLTIFFPPPLFSSGQVFLAGEDRLHHRPQRFPRLSDHGHRHPLHVKVLGQSGRPFIRPSSQTVPSLHFYSSFRLPSSCASCIVCRCHHTCGIFPVPPATLQSVSPLGSSVSFVSRVIRDAGAAVINKEHTHTHTEVGNHEQPVGVVGGGGVRSRWSKCLAGRWEAEGCWQQVQQEGGWSFKVTADCWHDELKRRRANVFKVPHVSV